MSSTARSSRQRSSRSSRPVRASRTRVQSYHEDSSSDGRLDEDTESDEDRVRRASLSLRPRSSNRIPPSYREESTDDDFEESSNGDPTAVMPAEASIQFTYPFSGPARNGPPARPRRNRTVKTRSQTRGSKRPPRKNRLELGRPLSKRIKIKEDNIHFIGSGIIPPWQSLPYHILFDIFLRAFYPLVDEKTMMRSSSPQWLVNIALMCHAFHEPALAALYHCPPLIPAIKSHALLSLLCRPQEELSTNYRNKIKELHVDVETLLLYKSGPTLGYFDLPKLLEQTPQVRRVRLYHKDDFVVGLPSWQIPRSKWVYPETLFDTMNSSLVHLRSWDWNSRFMETQQLLPFILGKHYEPAFRRLTELRLLHIASEDLDGDGVVESSNEREVILATAIKELPDLRHLEFLECSIVNEHLLPHMPSTLTSLTINNCDEVTALNFGMFLASHGQHLRELDLSHNRHLSLSFMVSLAECCQSLEKFKMDISIYDWSSYHDIEPHFAELLRPSDIPTWPATLQEIELIQLRKWDDVTAEVFFTSLINAAPELRYLRRLAISAILRIGWRDRASFREKWIGKLEKVFLRRTTPPNPNLRTLRKKDLQVEKDDPATQSEAQNSSVSTPSKRKSARLAQRKNSEAEDKAESGASYRASNADDPDLFIQGMCDTVMVRIDNQRPTETQFNEQDFLDDERSGDEDWNGNDFDADNGGHACSFMMDLGF
ncbi:uncharacterized protein ACLA_032140 [Aspergillus clavatus NRRL 1]|uniref:Uncharacterized protein n=1 Tax=Aspergillus clavatus (strain ATCC 1007 / CBS 513.65 / DSM 816 / NCTC 3887 / NRRL 1 / QM 1276 / 107) TaxID=344612 RepID=A1CS58_ASPCL|nr:uncharacterized protein ACLA_032140 [Aspergillus clavatus NRRL 1]EAW08479.1 conserved hypothetical protein [Aspergillus clavatus NRRL 1]